MWPFKGSSKMWSFRRTSKAWSVKGGSSNNRDLQQLPNPDLQGHACVRMHAQAHAGCLKIPQVHNSRTLAAQ